MDDREVVKAAQEILPHLWRLVGNRFKELELELIALLDRARAGEPVAHLILHRLNEYDTTREWVKWRLTPQHLSERA